MRATRAKKWTLLSTQVRKGGLIPPWMGCGGMSKIITLLLYLKIYKPVNPFLQLVPHLLIVIFVFNIIQEFNEGVPTFYSNDFHDVVFPAVVAGTTALALTASRLVSLSSCYTNLKSEEANTGGSTATTLSFTSKL